MHINQIIDLLDQASILADDASINSEEKFSDDPFTHLAQLVDTALAHAENIRDAGRE